MVVVVVVVVVVALEPATLLMVAVVGRGMSTDLFPDEPALKKVILLGLVQLPDQGPYLRQYLPRKTCIDLLGFLDWIFLSLILRRMTVYSPRAPNTKMMHAITHASIAVRPSA